MLMKKILDGPMKSGLSIQEGKQGYVLAVFTQVVLKAIVLLLHACYIFLKQCCYCSLKLKLFKNAFID